MLKTILILVPLMLSFNSHVLAQRNGEDIVEIRFKDGDIIRLNLTNRDDRSYNDFILTDIGYQIDYYKYPNKGELYRIVPEMPEFNKGVGNLKSYIKKQIKYPKEAYEKKLQGRVFLKFIVEKSGKIRDLRIIRGIGPALDKEAFTIIRDLPDWKPGMLDGKAVDTYYYVSILFEL